MQHAPAITPEQMAEFTLFKVYLQGIKAATKDTSGVARILTEYKDEGTILAKLAFLAKRLQAAATFEASPAANFLQEVAKTAKAEGASGSSKAAAHMGAVTTEKKQDTGPTVAQAAPVYPPNVHPRQQQGRGRQGVPGQAPNGQQQGGYQGGGYQGGQDRNQMAMQPWSGDQRQDARPQGQMRQGGYPGNYQGGFMQQGGQQQPQYSPPGGQQFYQDQQQPQYRQGGGYGGYQGGQRQPPYQGIQRQQFQGPQRQQYHGPGQDQNQRPQQQGQSFQNQNQNQNQA